MNKIKLIIQREYLTRVRKKSFLLTTFLVPLIFIGMYVGVIFLTKKSFDESHSHVYVVDDTKDVMNKLNSSKNVSYLNENQDLQKKIQNLQNEDGKTSILYIPKDFYESESVEFLSNDKPNLAIEAEIRDSLNRIIKDKKYESYGITAEIRRSIKSDVKIKSKEIKENGATTESNTEIAMGISLALSILVYISLFLYGSQVMRGIIEEKNSRIIEVIISSVKPFQLMMGKIVGIGLVGLTQFALWIVVSVILAGVASMTLVSKEELANQMMNNQAQQSQLLSNQGIENSSSTISNESIAEVISLLQTVDFPLIIGCFFIFFLGGYLIYSALFAAVGSAVDSETEASQFTLPITMPLLLTYALSFGVLINNPHGTVATWLSFIPFTSPIAMLVRIPFGVPTWQIVVSAILLILGFIFTTWIAARIYRVGILMYGKKASYKELLKWFRYKS
ncbi:MAG: ABC transporter permease [Sphingobacterium composti]|uniref:ABC transporter permease n=1 Tax=Sphingobacterium composti TaxID=363260 RepID=UPI001359B052|nr:ABC transporter permease [Sphingobacterium composti Ten et al. 2007 non Yoo et al. 2007]